ncbi:MAG: hypothetical protein ACM3UU_09375 [Ignavibacteriales bacterium]
MKRIVLLSTLLIFMIVFSGCAKKEDINTAKPDSNAKQTQQNNSWESGDKEANNSKNTLDSTGKIASTEALDANSNTSNDKQSAQIKPVGRKDAKLDIVPKIDFGGRSLNKRIDDLLNKRSLYVDKDFSDGIALSNYYEAIIITERYKDSILDGIKIGESINRVKQMLGKPSFVKNDYILYKTNRFYIGFKGAKNVEQAIIKSNPASYDKQVLNKTLSKLYNSEECGLNDIMQNDKKLSGFYDSQGHINGGGYYANSINGIEVTDFNEDSEVAIYNNFEGNLYCFSSDNRYKVNFKNEDCNINNLISDLDYYLEINKRFEKEGQLSPSGKYKFIYDWIYSMSQYFTIRTLDYSRADFRIPVSATSYEWLNDDYILYIRGVVPVPYVVRVPDYTGQNRNNQYEQNINVLYKLGLEENEDYGETKGDYNYTIKEVRDNTAVLYDEYSKKELKVGFDFNEEGNIVLQLK